jgi:hypothetical protein
MTAILFPEPGEDETIAKAKTVENITMKIMNIETAIQNPFRDLDFGLGAATGFEADEETGEETGEETCEEAEMSAPFDEEAAVTDSSSGA